MKITRANLNHLNEVAYLFDQYRQFYEQEPDLEGCRSFIRQRIMNDDSIIFVAQSDSGEIIGFTQLYRSFCSVTMKKILYLYDLYVAPLSRQSGVATALMTVAREYAETYGADRLTLQTAISNSSAQALYESLGYEKEGEFFTYNLAL